MASVFVYHVVGDLTVAKPELVEFLETGTVEAVIKAIGESTESGIPVWKRKKGNVVENSEMRQQRFVGILNPLDIVAFLGCMEDQEKALMTPVSEIVVPDKSLLKEVDPATRIMAQTIPIGTKMEIIGTRDNKLGSFYDEFYGSKVLEFQVSIMGQDFHYVDDFDMKNKKHWKIRVRCIHMWDAIKFMTKHEIVGKEMIFLDERGCKIQAFFRPTLFQKFSNIQEGVVYLISNFALTNNIGIYRYTFLPHKAVFYMSTQVRPVENIDVPRYGFHFVYFDKIIDKSIEDIYLIDVIRHITAIGDIVECDVNGDTEKHRRVDFRLQNLRSDVISCTMWDRYADQFAPYVRSTIEDSIIVIIQFVKLRNYQNQYKLVNAHGGGTRVIINDTLIPKIMDFKQSLHSSGIHVGTNKITPIPSGPSYSLSEQFLDIALFKPIDEILDVNKPCKCITIATVEDIDNTFGWYYHSCNQCKKKVRPEGDHFHCSKCESIVKFVIPRFKVTLTVKDDSGMTSFVIFDRDVKKWVNKSITKMLNSTAKG